MVELFEDGLLNIPLDKSRIDDGGSNVWSVIDKRQYLRADPRSY